MRERNYHASNLYGFSVIYIIFLMNNAIRQVTAQGKFVPHSYSLDHKNEFAWLVNSWMTACVPTYLPTYTVTVILHSRFNHLNTRNQSVYLSLKFPSSSFLPRFKYFAIPVARFISIFPLSACSYFRRFTESLSHFSLFLSLRLSVFHLLSPDLMFLWLSEYFVNYRVSVQSPRILISVSWCHFLNEFSAFDLPFCFVLQLMPPQRITSLQIIQLIEIISSFIEKTCPEHNVCIGLTIFVFIHLFAFFSLKEMR